MTAPRAASTADVAAALGLRPATVQMYARNGRIPFDTTPGGHRRFDVDEVRAALDLRPSAPVAPPTRSRGTHGWLVDALELESWAGRITARHELPEVVRMLVAGSVRELRSVEFRAGEGVGVGGWDGVVDAVRGNAWVPEGVSGWELGVSEDVTKKADEDYAARTKNPLGLTKSEAVFIFVTPRRWDQRDSWATARRAEGAWKDVRAYDADTLEQWLDETPAVHARITAMLGRDPDGARDVERAWADWAARTAPQLPADLVTAGRGEQVDQVLAWLHGEPSAISIEGESDEEALAFIAVCLLGLPEQERTALLSRALVVRTAAAWDEVLARAGADSGLVLIPAFAHPVTVEATDAGHHVAVPVDRNAVHAGEVIRLPRLRREPAREALLAAGVPEQRANDLARLARRSLLMLRRRLAVSGTALPLWAQPAHGGEIVPVVLAGAWREGHDADEQILSRLAGRPYPEISSLCTRWAAEDDMPVRREGPVWFCVSKPDAWGLLARLATARDLSRFREIAVEVLGAVDPALALEPGRRWAAGAFGITPPWSAPLRSSIAETIAMIATQNGDDELPAGGTGQEFADAIVGEILASANGDRSGQLWSSLSDVLPTLAEASPEKFLDAVDTGLDSGGLSAVFDPEAEGTPFGSPTHTGLLWSLEALAWSPQHLGSAALALAHLARLDPGGRWANRPDRSLNQIFLPWRPQTTATPEQRLAATDMVRDRAAPEVAWPFLAGLLPTPHSISETSYQPHWREWHLDYQPPQMGVAEWFRHAEVITGRLLEDVGLAGARWADLIARLPYMPEAQHDLVLGRLRCLDLAAFEEADRVAVAGALRTLVRDHRRFADASWALPADRVDRIEEQLRRFQGHDTSQDLAWLFANFVELPEVGSRDAAAEQQAIAQRQEDAVRDLLAGGGIGAIWELAGRCEAPRLLGYTAGRVTADLDEDVIAELDSADQARHEAAMGWITGRFEAAGWPWATSYLEHAHTWPASRGAAFLRSLPPSARAFDWADRLGTEVRERYWEKAPVLLVQDNADRERAARTLVELGHATSALGLLTSTVQHSGPADPDLVAEALSRATLDFPASGLPIFVHYVTSLLTYLDGQPQVDRRLLAQLEWRYLPLLEPHERPTRVLHQELTRNPEFFVEVIEMVFISEHDGQERQITDEQRQRATLGYQLLRAWHTTPGGLGTSEAPAGPSLAEWVAVARALLTKRKLLRAGDQFIGQVLSQTPEDPDGTWPGLPVRQIIEDARSQDLEQGINIAILNSRGMTWRALDTGGQPERALADKYQDYAHRVGTQWPRTRRMLLRIAENWDRRARQEDQLAAAREDFWA